MARPQTVKILRLGCAKEKSRRTFRLPAFFLLQLQGAKGGTFSTGAQPLDGSSQLETGQNDGCQMGADGIRVETKREVLGKMLVQWFVQWSRNYPAVAAAAKAAVVALDEVTPESNLKAASAAARTYRDKAQGEVTDAVLANKINTGAAGRAAIWQGVIWLAEHGLAEWLSVEQRAKIVHVFVCGVVWLYAMEEGEGQVHTADQEVGGERFRKAYDAALAEAQRAWGVVVRGEA